MMKDDNRIIDYGSASQDNVVKYDFSYGSRLLCDCKTPIWSRSD